MYWINLIKDIRLWFRFAKIAKQNKAYLEKNNLRVDWIGRIYTVINLPEEIANGNEYMHEAWVLQNLKPYTQVLLEMGIADYSYPSVEKIDKPNTSAFLVIIYPEAETLTFWRLFSNLFIWSLVFILIRAAYKFIISSPVIANKVQSFIDFIF